MIARAVEHSGARLRELHHEQWEDAALAALALVLAVAAASVESSLALPLFLGGVVVAFRAVVAFWRHWDLLDRLVLDRDAYSIPEVRARARQAATMTSRCALARAVRRRFEAPAGTRAVAFAAELEALAAELEDAGLELEPACAAVCAALLNGPALPPEDVRSRVRQIRDGFAQRPGRPA